MQSKVTDRQRHCFPWPVNLYGLLGLLGVVQVVASLVILHFLSTGMDLMRDYVSNLANEPLGLFFVGSAFIHGLGNLSLTLGLRGALHPGRLRTWAITLLGLAAMGILLAALFPVEPSGQDPSTVGRVHRTAASTTFMLELAAMFIFSVMFSSDQRWRRQQAVSLTLSVSAAIAVTLFVIAIQLDVAPGLAERVALAVFLAWEIWASLQLIKPA